MLVVLAAPLAYADFESDLSATADATSMLNLRELRASADNGDALAALRLGTLFFKGTDIDQDYAEAAKWFRRAAESGLAEGQFNLGMMYATGRGLPQDYKESVHWYLLAANQNLASAQLNMGVAYSYGEGVEKNASQAVKWFQLAADQGDAVAQFNLAALYANGQGVEHNPAEARRLAQLSSANGYPFADALLSDLDSPHDSVEPAATSGVFLQLAAFKNRDQAHEYLQKIQVRLAVTEKKCILLENNGWQRIVIGPYNDTTHARRDADELKQNLGLASKIRLSPP